MFSFQKVLWKFLSAVLLPSWFRGSWIYSHIACGNGKAHLENKKIKMVHGELAWGKMNTFLHSASFSQIDMKQAAVNKAQLTIWGRVTHICVSKLSFIGSDNGLSPGRRQAIIWTNAGIWLIGTVGTNFNEILIEIHTFSFQNIHLKMSSGKWRPFCLGLNVLSQALPCCVFFMVNIVAADDLILVVVVTVIVIVIKITISISSIFIAIYLWYL